tara:strand:- start:993 stop:3140 length:2148 start_codon:yes stop_codon:yes gene_type:complete
MSEAYADDMEAPEGYEGVDYDAEAEGQTPERAPFDLMAAIQSPNLAFDLPDDVLARIGAKVVEEHDIDENSRVEAGWVKRYDSAMKLALQVAEQKNTPWPNASNVKFPLISTAAIQFNARAYSALVDGPDLVKGAVRGRPTPEKQERASRIGKHMSYQLLEEMDDWEEDTDRLLMQLPIVGCAFRKSWFDPIKGYNCSHLVSAKDFVVNYMTKDLSTCPRATHVLTFHPHEVKEKMRSGLWLDVDLGRPTDAANDDEAPHTFYEQHRLWDMDDDDYPEPYTVTVEKETGKVVRIVARYDERGIMQGEDGTIVRIMPTQTFTKYGFIPAPDGSFYDLGFGTLLNPLQETINTTINQMIDAATLSNLGGGFIGDGVSIKSGNQAFRPGEWRKVAANGGSLRDNIVPLPVKEPSSVLFSLLGMLIDAAKEVTATQDILSGDAGKGTMPVGTVTAVIEQGLKTFTAIVKRLHRALKKELGILYALNGRYLDEEAYFTFQDQEGAVARQDYMAGDCDVVPVSDPNMATDMQRMNNAQMIMGVAAQAGGNVQEAGKMALESARVPMADIERVFPKQEGPKPPDPKMIEVQAKAMLDERRVDIEEATAVVANAKVEAEIEALQAQLAMMGPDILAAAEAYAREQVQQALAMVENGGKPEQGGPAGPPDVSGMGEPPVNEGFSGAPEGQPEPFGGPMEPGAGDEPFPADQGPFDGGDVQPPMG